MSKPIQSIERAAAILRLLSGRTRRLNLSELAGELGLPKGTVYGILRTLGSVGFVEQDPEFEQVSHRCRSAPSRQQLPRWQRIAREGAQLVRLASGAYE